MNDQEGLLREIFDDLKERTGIEGDWEAPFSNEMGEGFYVEFKLNGGSERFPAILRKELRNHQLAKLEKSQTEIDLNNFRDAPLMVIAERLFPQVKKELRERGFAYLEGGGNLYVRTEKHWIWLEGGKRTRGSPSSPKNRAFSKTGLKVLFRFLRDEEALNAPYRNIAEDLGIAVANIGYVKMGLKQAGFLLQEDRKRARLVHKEDLMERFVTAYAEKLKPTLFMGNYSFFKDKDRMNWRKMKGFGDERTQWGGEPAGAVLTEELIPETYLIYTEERLKDLTKKFRLVPNSSGEIGIYRKFWKFDEDRPNRGVVPPLLVYTDLMNSGDSRCRKIAEEIFENF